MPDDIKIDTIPQQVRFITTCADFVPYMESDSMGLSPGNTFFKQSAEGLQALKEKLPAHADTLQRGIDFYMTLAEKVQGPRGSMYPRGSEVFGDDFAGLEGLHTALLDIVDELEGQEQG